jgi:hypothetical protein
MPDITEAQKPIETQNVMRKKLRFLSWAAVVLFSIEPYVLAVEQEDAPSIRHGVEQVVGGVLLEFPKSVLAGTMQGPPIAGTVVGALGGVVGALQKTVSGLIEMAVAFKLPE